MEVLVAGATGALGVPLTRALIAAGHGVLGLTRTPGNARRLTDIGADAIVADALHREALLTAVSGRRADAVIHVLTALKKTPMRHSGMHQTDLLRTIGTANLLAAARALGARRFVTESMTLGYGYGDWGTTILTEETPFGPPGRSSGLEAHLAAFRYAEQQAFEASQEGIEGIALRYGAFYGPGAGMEGMARMLKHRLLPLVDGGRAVTSWVYIDDAARATVAALERGRPREAYNVVDDEPVSFRDFFGQIAESTGAPRPISVPGWLIGVAAPYGTAFLTTTLRASNSKAKNELGWKPLVRSYRGGLRRVTDELRAA